MDPDLLFLERHNDWENRRSFSRMVAVAVAAAVLFGWFLWK